uniref:Uncharacterized protein n=1 Tax=Prymnesium polylepis TaxID=72548 RepID=A0A7S4JFE7_9EUKA
MVGVSELLVRPPPQTRPSAAAIGDLTHDDPHTETRAGGRAHTPVWRLRLSCGGRLLLRGVLVRLGWLLLLVLPPLLPRALRHADAHKQREPVQLQPDEAHRRDQHEAERQVEARGRRRAAQRAERVGHKA